jgi:hypothetical protein
MFLITTTIASLLIGAVAALIPVIAFYVPPLFSRRSLAYEYDESVPVINEQAKAASLTVAYAGNSLTDPHVIRLELANSGKRDIPSSLFDQDMPIQFDFGVKVVAILHSSYAPASLISPKVEFDGNSLKVGPSLIPRSALVEYVLLVDGSCGRISCRAPLEEVDIRERVRAKDGRAPRPLNVRVVVTYLLVSFLVWWAIQQPANAASLIHDIAKLLSNAVQGLSDFVASI